MDALVNAIFVTSPSSQEIEDDTIPGNVVSIAFLPVSNECQMVISPEAFNDTNNEVHDVQNTVWRQHSPKLQLSSSSKQLLANHIYQITFWCGYWINYQAFVLSDVIVRDFSLLLQQQQKQQIIMIMITVMTIWKVIFVSREVFRYIVVIHGPSTKSVVNLWEKEVLR